MLELTKDLALCSDGELLQGVAARRHDYLLELYDRYFQPAYSLAWRMIGDSAQAEARVHTIFISLLHEPHPAAVSEDFCAWLLGRVQRDIRGWQQAQRQEAPAPSAEPASGAAQRKHAGLRRFYEQREQAAAALAALRTDEREILEMAYFKGMSTEQIAALVARPPDAVREVVTRAMFTLRPAHRS